MSGSINFGGNRFVGDSIPLACGGRYFILEPQPSGTPQVSVLYADNLTRFIEVLRNKPCDNSLTTGTVSPPGIVTVSDKSSGSFLYKIRPASETSVAFGKIAGNGVEAAITDTSITVYRVTADGGKTTMVTLQRNMFSGPMVAVLVKDDGGVGIGAAIPQGLLTSL